MIIDYGDVVPKLIIKEGAWYFRMVKVKLDCS